MGRYKGETAERAVKNFPVMLFFFVWIPENLNPTRFQTRVSRRCDEELEMKAVANSRGERHILLSKFYRIRRSFRFGGEKEKSWYISRYAWKVESDSDTCCVGSTTTTWRKVSPRLIKGKNISRANIFWGKISLNYFDIKK